MLQLNYRDSRPIYEQVRDGLRRLIRNGYKFTESAKTRANAAEALVENCNIIEFLGEAVGFDKSKAVSSRLL